uniref:Na+/H+ antiporter protein n=1 Tax=Solanum tuberosum TaxID=4113 RepID=M1CUP4_SOLTU
MIGIIFLLASSFQDIINSSAQVWFVLKKLYHICCAFIHAHRIARQLLLDYTGDNGNAAIVVAESEELEARKFLENVKNSMPKVCECFRGNHCSRLYTLHQGFQAD